MENSKSTQISLPHDVNRKLKILAIKSNLTLRDYCVKVLTDHAADK